MQECQQCRSISNAGDVDTSDPDGNAGDQAHGCPLVEAEPLVVEQPTESERYRDLNKAIERILQHLGAYLEGICAQRGLDWEVLFLILAIVSFRIA